MNTILMTMLVMTQSTVHNIGQVPRELPVLTAEVTGPNGPPSYAYDEEHCSTTPSGVIVCPRRRR